MVKNDLCVAVSMLNVQSFEVIPLVYKFFAG